MKMEEFTVRELEIIKMLVDEHCKSQDYDGDGMCFTHARLVIDDDEWVALNSLQDKLGKRK